MFTYEESTSANQALTFKYADRYLRDKTGKRIQDVVDLRTRNGEYSNLALIISDQCPWHTTIYSERYGEVRRLEGSIYKQLEDAITTIGCFNHFVRTPGFSGAVKKFPTIAIREALTNMVIHRSYDSDDDSIVIVFYDALSIISPGAYWKSDGLTRDTVRGVRNRGVSKILEEMKSVRRQNMGIRRMKCCYDRTRMSPIFVSSRTHFMTTLPAIMDIGSAYENRRHRIRMFMTDKQGVSARDVAENQMMSLPYTKKILQRMEEESVIFGMGVGTKRVFYLCDRRNEKCGQTSDIK